MVNKTIGFIGAGNMGGAILKGIIKNGLFTSEQVVASDISEDILAALSSEYGIKVFRNNVDAAKTADILVFAVKPHLIAGVIDEIKAAVKPDVVVVSIAAGTTLAQIEDRFGSPVHLARVMPNTPCLVGEGMSAVFPGSWITPDETEEIRRVFAALGQSIILDEKLVDAVGAVSGSSPAFVYVFIEAMADAAVKGGMPRGMAYQFASQAVLGAAKMVLETGLHPGQLKDQVCSPGGSTIEAIEKLEQFGLRGAVFAAMNACMEKTVKMSGK